MVRRAIHHRVTLTANSTIHTRDGNVVEYKRGSIGKSRYHEQLEEELLFASPNIPESDSSQPDPFVVDESTIRYWSDYNRVDYHPRSIQRLPDLPDWDLGVGDWATGKETFDKQNNQVSCSLEDAVMASYPSVQDGYSLMDDSVRMFVEECDSLQVLHACVIFGSMPPIHTETRGCKYLRRQLHSGHSPTLYFLPSGTTSQSSPSSTFNSSPNLTLNHLT